MQAADLVKYIHDPQLLNQQSIAGLQKLVADFPYFQPAHLLLSMASRKWDATAYQQSLKKTAIVATNREHLFNLVHAAENYSWPATEVLPAEETVRQEPETGKPAVPKEQTQGTAPEEEETEQAAKEINEELPQISEHVITPEEQLEKEIEKQVVNAFVEKEILKTPELHHAPTKQEPENFVEWLALLKKNNGQPRPLGSNSAEQPLFITDKVSVVETAVSDTTQAKKLKHRALIDKIIESSPGLIRTKEEQKFFTPDTKAKESLLENEHLVTETLAKIYALQGSVNKAVRAYEILSLKFPQKSAYFATLIQKLKNNQ